MPAYATLSVVVDGALELEEDHTDDTVLRERLREIADDAAQHGLRTDVYILQHAHDETDHECHCMQYVQDHRPVHTLNEPDSEV